MSKGISILKVSALSPGSGGQNMALEKLSFTGQSVRYNYGMSSNPTMRDDMYGGLPFMDNGAMTINGTIYRSATLGILVMATFLWAWNSIDPDLITSSSIALIVGGSILGTILSLIISFKPTGAPILAPVFALVEGYVLGGFSVIMESQYPGIVMQASLATMAVFLGLLLFYRTRILKITSRFIAVTQLLMWSIFFIYLTSFGLSLVGIEFPFIHESSPIGIGFSILVIIIASMMLLTDFHFIEEGEKAQAPKYMEWYGAFALLVSLVWIYIEMLRLFAKVRR
jgi:uncharacterized YccA/Bax inhibitor family protein